MKIKITESQYKRTLLKESTTTDNQSSIDFEKLYSSLWGKMLNTVCRKYTIDSDKAQDYCQNGFIKVYDNISKYDGKGSLEGWVRRVINNNILDELRKSKIEIDDRGEDGFDLTKLKSYEDTYEESDNSMDKIMGLLKYLPPSYKRAFEMYYLDGLQHNEIGEILGISDSTSKTNLMKGKRILKKYLENGVPQSKKN
jgi:RNA polymerase sigma factor (sigma-70 family)